MNFHTRTRLSDVKDCGRVKAGKGCFYVVLNTNVHELEDTPLRGMAQTRIPRSAKRRVTTSSRELVGSGWKQSEAQRKPVGAFNSRENIRYAQVKSFAVAALAAVV